MYVHVKDNMNMNVQTGASGNGDDDDEDDEGEAADMEGSNKSIVLFFSLHSISVYV